MRVISMVPSWTETLIECGVNVVGRTRFCVHPKPSVAAIPAVGGTKDIDWQKVKALKPDLLILDREENPLKMAEECPVEYLATHITRVEDVARDLTLMSQKLESRSSAGMTLDSLALRWRQAAEAPARERALESTPAIVTWLRPPAPSVKEFVYVIWRKPWMAVSRSTFIGSMLVKAGVGHMQRDFGSPYAEFRLEELDPAHTMLLFSTEPFPFLKQKETPETVRFAAAVADGEAYSWFGLRSLKFLESLTSP
ncbi:MAG TPA: helical backbone metal receptor [Bdellovibrionales bacterium]|nr:helical backbone metal receptor [Bdellovibrionales bacterium]